MAADDIDPIFLSLTSLRICAFLEPMKEEDLGVLRNYLDTNESALDQHLETLATARYIDQWRFKRMGRNTVRIALNEAGRRAFRAHLAALAQLAKATPEQHSQNA